MVTAAVVLLAVWGTALAVSDPAPGNAGETVSVEGLMSALHADGTLDVLAAGDALRVGDILETGAQGFGVIQLGDGSRMTLRPGTRLALETSRLDPQAPFIGLRLLRGGIRALSGWVAKQVGGEHFQLATPTAVVRVRGTEFDARLCEGDCAAETAEGQALARPQAPTIARVVQVQGHLAALEPDGRARGLSPGSAVFQNDRLETATDSFAVVAFQDGSRVTLQADTIFFVEDYAYGNDPAAAQSSFFRLIRGGMRVLTGAIARNRPDRFQVATPTAVAGVRGTGFDLNLCQAPCLTADTTEAMVGRVLLLEGAMSAELPEKQPRALEKGDPIYSGEILQTGGDGVAVVVFRDGGRLSLQPGTRFEVSQYHHAGDQNENGVFRLYRGGVRMLTGWLARRPGRFTVHTATAVLGVRGTGFDLLCTGACRDDGGAPPADPGGAGGEDLGLVARVWEGTISLTNASGEVLVETGQVVQVASFDLSPVFMRQAPAILDRLPAPRPDQVDVDLESLFSGFAPGPHGPPMLILSTWDGEVILTTRADHLLTVRAGETYRYAGGPQAPERMTDPPAFIRQSPAPRPDQVPVDHGRLFEAVALAGTHPGLYVGVYDGDVVLANDYGDVFIGRGEAGFAAFDPGRPIRLADQPLFFIFDSYPSPGPAGPDAGQGAGIPPDDRQGFGIRKETECEIR